MRQKQVGKTDVWLSEIGLGTNAVGGHNLYPNLDEEEGKELVREALGEGINFLDTAYIYGNGRSEELIGEAIKDFKRDEIVLATKAAHVPYSKNKNNAPDFLTQSVEDALRRLQTDYIDIFYIHFPDEKTPKNEAVKALVKAKQAGKIRAIGVSNFSLGQLEEANQDGQVDIVQDEYNLIERKNETTLMTYCLERDISFVPYFPLASGLLTGKYKNQAVFPSEDLRSKQVNFKGHRFTELTQKVMCLAPIAKQHQTTIATIVLAWYLMRDDITMLIPGAKNSKQVISNKQASHIQLSKEEFLLIDKLFKEE